MPHLFYPFMQKITLNFTVSPKNDAEEFSPLYKGHENLRNPLRKYILKTQPDFKFDKLPNKAKLVKFVAAEYKRESPKMHKVEAYTKLRWGKIEPKFYDLTQKVFPGFIVPDDKYEAYPSIWPFYIRNFKTRRISFPYLRKNKNEPLFVIAHELLHVFFYSYLFQKYPKFKAKMQSKQVWDFSEAINVVIQGQEEWVRLFKVIPHYYPEHKQLFLKLQKFWDKEKNLDKLIQEFL